MLAQIYDSFPHLLCKYIPLTAQLMSLQATRQCRQQIKLTRLYLSKHYRPHCSLQQTDKQHLKDKDHTPEHIKAK